MVPAVRWRTGRSAALLHATQTRSEPHAIRTDRPIGPLHVRPRRRRVPIASARSGSHRAHKVLVERAQRRLFECTPKQICEAHKSSEYMHTCGNRKTKTDKLEFYRHRIHRRSAQLAQPNHQLSLDHQCRCRRPTETPPRRADIVPVCPSTRRSHRPSVPVAACPDRGDRHAETETVAERRRVSLSSSHRILGG